MNYNELHKYLRKLFNDYLRKYKITKEDKEDVIQDVMIKIFNKVQDGTLNGSVEDNKNYIFITIRNAVYYKVYSKKDLIEYQEYLPDLHILPPTIEQEMDNRILSLQLKECIKSKKFTNKERIIIEGILDGYEYVEIKRKMGFDGLNINFGYSYLKTKIKEVLNPTFKYIVIYENKTLGFKHKYEIAKYLNMSIDQFNNYMKLNKTKFPKYQIIRL